ncbi:MAG TPA: ABC transporter ATP-binding protein [Bacteroidia bacterium]|jgi:subfamily B ATP-binding cassette protein MsbA|nr:ABC transporter ATP-binding protein [Bacteroidia bacterium]
MLKDLGKILHYIKRYKTYAILNVIFNIISQVFNIFSFAMIIPLTQILFTTDKVTMAKIISDGPPALKLSGEALSQYFKYAVVHLLDIKGAEYVLLMFSIVFVLVIFLKNLTRYLAIFFMAPIRNGVVKDIRNEMYEKIMVLPLSYYSAERKGDIMARMTNDITEIEWSVMQSIEMLTINPLQIISLLGFLIFLSPQLTLLVFILLPITGLLIARIGKSLKRSSTKSKEHMGTLFSMIEETLGGIRIIKAFNAEDNSRTRFQTENSTYTKVMNKVYRKTDLASPLSEFMGSIVIGIVLYLGGQLVWSSSHLLDGALFVAYIATFSQVIPPAKAFSGAYYSVQKGLASLDRINKILHSEVTIREIGNPLSVQSFEKEIEYKDVSFAYQRGDTGHALKDINLKIPKGKTIAIVGQSGSGKSTLVDMLPRFYDPSSGKITIDGIPLTDLRLKDVRSLMGIVTQESILFNDTVKNNITFGMTGVTDEQVIAAAKVANAHDFIMRMENGYETNIGDRGSKLSGGERQRMSIARAILKNPPILILDEATSALDTESERLVQDALTKLMAHRTSIVIAHRLSTIKNADEIIVMQKSLIVERGTHAELLAHNGTYKKLYDLQSFV